MKRIILILLISSLFSIFFSCTRIPQVPYKPVIGYEKPEEAGDIILENEYLELFFSHETASIVLRDKIRGTEWYSTPPDSANDPLANVITSEMMKSQFSLQYSDVAGVGETLFSSNQSVERGNFEFEVIDGVLEVNYTVGNIPRTFIFPPAAPESWIVPFLDRMETGARNRVEASYRIIDINNLRATDNRSELLSTFPDLANEKVYVLRDNTQEFMKEQIEEFFEEAGYTRDDYLIDAARYMLDSSIENPAFNITIQYALEGKSLVVKVPFNRITYQHTYPIVRLDILPFFGAGGLEDEGYLLIPDGSGALLYFNNGRHNQLSSVKPIYGRDEATPIDAVVNDNKSAFPVFGIQKNGAAMLCIIEDGASYANVQAHVSGWNSSYNRVYAYFDMVHGAMMDISGRSDRAVYIYELELPQDESITMRYILCEDDGYVGMAKEYRSWILDRYPFLANKNRQTDIPIAIEIIGAVNKTQHRLGIPFDLPLKLTTYKDAENMVNDFASFGWKNVNIKLTGWFNRSYDHSVPNRIRLIRNLGNSRNLKNLVSASNLNGYNFYPEADFMFMRDINLFDGYSLYRDAARYVSRKRVERYPFSFVWFGERTQWGKLNSLARPEVSMRMIDNFAKYSASLDSGNIAFRNMGSRLGGDYNERRKVSREASMHMRMDKFKELSESGTKIMVNSGFFYSVPYADFIINMALDCQNFGITDVAVPFYQIALSGLIPYAGSAINLAEDYTKNLLRIIESGAVLYFSFMKEPATELQETKFRQFYANDYDKWIGDADALYRQFNNDFRGIYGQAITDHIILTPGVTVTVYEDGSKVVVNKADFPWDYNGIILRADSYIVERAGR